MLGGGEQARARITGPRGGTPGAALAASSDVATSARTPSTAAQARRVSRVRMPLVSVRPRGRWRLADRGPTLPVRAFPLSLSRPPTWTPHVGGAQKPVVTPAAKTSLFQNERRENESFSIEKGTTSPKRRSNHAEVRLRSDRRSALAASAERRPSIAARSPARRPRRHRVQHEAVREFSALFPASPSRDGFEWHRHPAGCPRAAVPRSRWQSARLLPDPPPVPAMRFTFPQQLPRGGNAAPAVNGVCRSAPS